MVKNVKIDKKELPFMLKLVSLTYYLFGLILVGLFIYSFIQKGEGAPFGVLGILFGLPMIFTAWGLSKAKKWARGVAIGFAFLFLVSPLIIAGLYLIFNKEVKSLFSFNKT